MLKHHVFLLHGITDDTNTDKDYKEFCNKLRKQFKSKYKDELDNHIELIPIKWDHVVNPVEQALYEKCFGKIRSSDKVLVSSILHPLDQATGLVNAMTHTPDAFQTVASATRWQSWRGWRYFTTLFMGDVISYVDEHDNGIRRDVWQSMKEYLDKPEVPTFSIIGHGLGGVIAYDFLYALLKADGPQLYNWGDETGDHRNHKLLDKMRKSFRNFYSIGTPVSLFMLRKKNLWKRENGDVEFRIDNPFFGTKHKWLNFVDTDDVAAYPVENLFNRENQIDKPSNPKDVFVKTGWLPPFAHINYWRNKTVADEIAKQLKPDGVHVEEREPALAAR